MADKNLFAPPSKDEIKAAQGGLRTPPTTEDDLFKPPTPEEISANQEGPGLLAKGLDYGARGLDYVGGIARTGLATGAGLLKGDNVVDHDDVVAALKGKAPTSAEYLQRLGVDEGPSVAIPFTDNKRVSLRDAEGFALDVGTDPLTLISKGVRAVRPAGEAMEAGGRAIYKSGLKKVDEKLAEKGAKSLSEALLEKGGKVGTTKTIAKESEGMLKDALAERSSLYQKAAEKGASIDMGFPMEKAEAQIAKMMKNPGLQPMAKEFSELLQRYKDAGKVGLDTLSEWKTSLNEGLPASAFEKTGKIKGEAAKFKKALAEDFRNSIVEAGNAAEKGLGDKIDKLNETMQTSLEARKPLAAQIRRGNSPHAVTAVDGMLAGAGILARDPITGVKLVLGKKAIQAANTTLGRTAVGRGLIDLGKSGAVDALIRQGIIESQRKNGKGLISVPGMLSDKDTP